MTGVVDVVRLTRPGLEELAELAAGDEEAFGHTALRSFDLGVVARAGGLFVARVDGQTAACCQLVRTFDEPGVFWVVGFWVRPPWQGRGLGRALLTAVAREVRAAEGFGLMLTVEPDNIRAINLYSSFGFRFVEEAPEFYGPGEDRHVLRWEEDHGS
ncbi:MAG: GNAT family N-acetyltransferase [Thermoleophilia bacterium]